MCHKPSQGLLNAKNCTSIVNLWLIFLCNFLSSIQYIIMSCEMEVNREMTVMESPRMNCTS